MTEDQIQLEEDPDGRVIISARIKRKGLTAARQLGDMKRENAQNRR
jgi:hypothetical protein